MKIHLLTFTRFTTNLVLLIVFLLSFFSSQKVFSQARTYVNPGLEFGFSTNSRMYDTNFGFGPTFNAGSATTNPWYTSHPAQPNSSCSAGTGTVGACHPLEAWASGFYGVPSAQGINFVELNAFVSSMIYQNLYLQTGDIITYYYRHRARDRSQEQARMLIEDQNQTVIAVINQTANPSSTSAWSINQGTYTFTGTSGIYRVGFRAIVAGNSAGSGNFLDDTRITLLPIVDLKLSEPNRTVEGQSNGSLFLRINGAITANTTVAVELINPQTGEQFASPEDFSLTPVTNSLGTATVTRTAGTNIYLITIPPGNYDGATNPGFSNPTNNEDGVRINITALLDNIKEPLETYRFEIKEQNTNGSTNNFNSTVSPVFGDQYIPVTESYFIEDAVCYNSPSVTGAATDSNIGITLLRKDKINLGTTNWPMSRKSANMVLESNTKGFVITRLTTVQVNALVSPQEGMMVYDTTEKCLKIYDGTAWHCFNTPTCP